MYYPCQTYSLADLKKYTTVNMNDVSDNKIKFLCQLEEDESAENCKRDPIIHNWDYHVNDYGYRGEWKLNPENKKIGFFGCSFTFGVGVNDTSTFANVVQSKFKNSEAINLGQGGSSIHRIAKIVSASLKVIDFDAIVLTLPASDRFAVMAPDNVRLCEIVPGFTPHFLKNKAVAVHKLLSQEDLNLILIDYIHWIKAETKHIKHVLWGSWSDTTYELLSNIIEPENLLGVWKYDRHEIGRDMMHPGIQPHKYWASRITESLRKQNY